VYTRVASQLVGSTEAFATSRKLTCVRLLARVRTDVSGLMLKPMEGSVAKRALVWSRKILSFFWIASVRSHRRRHEADSGSHVTVVLRIERTGVL
jgi:hypothetical protein